MSRRKQRLARIAWANEMSDRLNDALNDAAEAREIAAEAFRAMSRAAIAREMPVLTSDRGHVRLDNPDLKHDHVTVVMPVVSQGLPRAVDTMPLRTTTIPLRRHYAQFPNGIIVSWVAPDVDDHARRP